MGSQSANCLSFSVFLICVSPVQLTDGKGGKGAGAEPNHTTARKLRTLETVKFFSDLNDKLC